MDSMNPCSQSSGFMDLLNSKTPTIIQFSQLSSDPSPLVDVSPPGRREARCKWKMVEDIALISAWLNTSKDAVVANEQKAAAFWTRVAGYYASCPKVVGLQTRGATHCKQRWGKINDIVCKFVGSFEAAKRQRRSGCNEDDVLKEAYEIFYNDHQLKFTLEHAWRELRNDQKWCDSLPTNGDGSSKRRKCVGGTQSASSHSPVEDEAMARPPGVKAAKGKGKKSMSNTSPLQKEGSSMEEFQSMWEIKEKDLTMKERIKKIGVLEILLGKGEPLSELEEAVKNKLLREQLQDSTV